MQKKKKIIDMKLGVENHYSRISLDISDGNNFIKISKIILGKTWGWVFQEDQSISENRKHMLLFLK